MFSTGGGDLDLRFNWFNLFNWFNWLNWFNWFGWRRLRANAGLGPERFRAASGAAPKQSVGTCRVVSGRSGGLCRGGAVLGSVGGGPGGVGAAVVTSQPGLCRAACRS